jgi:hypothetical protein
MGGTSSSKPVVAKPVEVNPLEGYNSRLLEALRLSSNLTDAAIALPPELRIADTDALQKAVARESLVNELKSRELDRQLNPEVATMREKLPREVLSELEGGPSTELSNLWVRQGLEDAIATGTRLGSGFARSSLADRTRRDFIADRDRIQTKAASIMAGTPRPVAGLDPGAIASNMTAVRSANADARDSHRGEVLGFLGNNASNVLNAFQQAMQMETQRRTNNAQLEAARRSGNAQATNAMTGANLSNSGNLTGSLIAGGTSLAGAGLLAF